MSNIKVTLQYDGSRYLGWTRPATDGYEKTISYRISSVLKKLTGEDITLFAGAKTDPKVHALCQTVNFHTNSSLSSLEFLEHLNKFLPKDIRILSAQIVSNRFRADLNATSKTYLYRICTSPVSDLFTEPYTMHVPLSEIDLSAMRKAANSLIGKHDFCSFSGTKKKKGTEKEIFDISISLSQEANDQRFDLLAIKLCANDFLYQMPERIVEFLLKNGTNKKIRCDSSGLFLHSISYQKSNRPA